VPGPSVVSYSQPGISYSLGAGTTFNTVGNTYDIRDLFGGYFTQSTTNETGNVVFSDASPGFADTVYINAAAPFQISKFEVLLDQDSPTSNARSCHEFLLYDNTTNTLISDTIIVPYGGNYYSTYGTSNLIEILGTVTNAPLSSSYKLEFINNVGSGVRAVDFAAQAVPEPSIACFGVAGLSVSMMRRRR
jgi:hypothetical protein